MNNSRIPDHVVAVDRVRQRRWIRARTRRGRRCALVSACPAAGSGVRAQPSDLQRSVSDAPARRNMRLLGVSTLLLFFCTSGLALQIQCYQCEMTHDCSTPEFVVNCTINVQDMCQKEVLVKDDGVHYRKSCASSGACLIASSGYQQFCTGKLNSVCITCCNTPLCNGPRQKKRPQSSAGVAASSPWPLVVALLSSVLC
ncbi:ly6/PLAUR domain-containing protein 1-like [Takifugu flavidus]|uniref:Ly6/PLAUR domain-containing protein 1 n=2 Tax=Takifugu TaxID=31032 RepID=A0A5C6PN94_9TELE|nr:ly6/PLAUR domain-containing protein 1-like [Takifugu flavidus]TWW80331.1 Ly6/PLAUR domain-containing protein 1 [Takifugu flavidus]